MSKKSNVLVLQDPSLVVLIGASGSGKSTLALKHFRPTEVVSSDVCRGLVSDNETDQSATPEAFALLHCLVEQRLKKYRLTVVDATNVKKEARQSLLDLARKYHLFATAIVLDLPERVSVERNMLRPDRNFPVHVVRNQRTQLRNSLVTLQQEGFRQIRQLHAVEQVDELVIQRQKLWSDRRDDAGPFDIIGDVHGCFRELKALLLALGYELEEGLSPAGEPRYSVRHPGGRRVIFLGDLVDRGPQIVEVLRLAMDMVADGMALCIAGNHEAKLTRKLDGKDIKLSHGLAQTMAELNEQSPAFRERVRAFTDGLVSHYWLDDGQLVVAHAGLKEEFFGRSSNQVRTFSLFGETTGETDDYGLPVRLNWAAEYRGRPMVIYGHTPVLKPQWLNNTLCIDTGCVFGGALTALRYPERELVSIPAQREYYAPLRPLQPLIEEPQDAALTQVLDLKDVTGKRTLQTRFDVRVLVPEENASTALEALSRFAVDLRLLIYLPPTMSPAETSKHPDLLEHPDEAFAYYRNMGLTQVICEAKHMGSRAVVIVGRTDEAMAARFGMSPPTGHATLPPLAGTCYTRTGRPFFRDSVLEQAFLQRVRAGLEQAGLFDSLQTDWICLDCELMPWSVKAQELITHQYAPVGAAARAALPAAVTVLEQAVARGISLEGMLEHTRARQAAVEGYDRAWRQYVWPVSSLSDLKLAPFHLLASEGKVHIDQDHRWHLQTLARLAEADPGLFITTDHRVVELADAGSCAAAVAWWQSLTDAGGEGMVVKPLPFIARTDKGMIQPGIKCRGREYLRIIYGPEYTLPEHLGRLKSRGLSARRGLAQREFMLGLEALERFVERAPLRMVHECVFGVMALESEPTDPRL